MKESSLVVLA